MASNLVELLAYSGMRLNEAVSLRWRDVQFESGRFVVTGGDEGTKNHEVRTAPLFPACALLERLGVAQPHAADDHVIGIASAKNAMASACEKAGLRDFTHHALRHYFASNAIELGIDFKVIAQWVGHKDGGLLVARTYGYLRDSHWFEMAKRMTFSAESGTIPRYSVNEPNDAQRPPCADSAFGLYFKIPSVSVTYGHSSDLGDKTFTSANHLLK